MTTKSQRPKGWEGTLSPLNAAIDTINLAKEVSTITPAKAAFDSVGALLTIIRVGFPTVCAVQLLANVYRIR